ncbi:MAG: 50S ribosomal protein P1 [Thermoprotei archaeon]|nr:50S ribosomal protein P1 [TACK group archaeon]
MEYVYASLLIHEAGKEINEENLKKVLEAAGFEVDDVRVKATVLALKQVNIDEVIKTASAAAVAPAAQAPAPAEAPKAAEKKEEPKKEEEEKEEEEAAEGLGALFG